MTFHDVAILLLSHASSRHVPQAHSTNHRTKSIRLGRPPATTIGRTDVGLHSTLVTNMFPPQIPDSKANGQFRTKLGNGQPNERDHDNVS